MKPELSLKYHAELERLDAERAHYERQWSKVPRFGWVALSVPVSGLIWGWGAAVVALLVSLALVGTRAYLIAMRKGENRWNRERLLDDMGALERSRGSELDRTVSRSGAPGALVLERG